VTIFTLWFEGDWLPMAAGLVGLGWGFLSDRLAARWPEHEDGTIRRVDWRTPIVVVVGGLAFAATVARFGADPRTFLIVGVYVAALVVLFATDLDQRLLPDVITLPLIALAAAVTLGGWNPFIRTNDEFVWALVASALVPLALFLIAIPFGQGAIGQGDLKLLVSVGLLAGAANLFYGLVAGALAAGISVAVLVFVRRLTLKSFVPYGPFLILGALWVILGLQRP
jgi:leader peptidase (prepilin peptidase) / N-methyltransferase